MRCIIPEFRQLKMASFSSNDTALSLLNAASNIYLSQIRTLADTHLTAIALLGCMLTALEHGCIFVFLLIATILHREEYRSKLMETATTDH